MPLTINLEDLGPEEEGPFSKEGVRVGSLLVSAQGIRAPVGAPECVLSPADLLTVPDAAGGFLGKGSSGVVRQAVHRRTGALVAVKEMKVASQAHLTEIRRELETLYDRSAQASPHMVDFCGAYTFEGSVFIAVECMDGTLADLPRPVPLDVLAHITRSTLRGLQYLHRTRHLIHRDLKPSNVLFNRATGDIKISDFGVSSHLECTKGDAHSFVGTVTYMSPERLRGDSYSYAADIWSLGLVVAELALGACPYPGLRSDSVEGRFWALLQHLSSTAPALDLPAGMDSELADFISACVAKPPESRPTCTELLGHPFLTSRCSGGVQAGAVGGEDERGAGDGTSEAALDEADRAAVRAWLALVGAASPAGPGRCPGARAVGAMADTGDGVTGAVCRSGGLPRTGVDVPPCPSHPWPDHSHPDSPAGDHRTGDLWTRAPAAGGVVGSAPAGCTGACERLCGATSTETNDRLLHGGSLSTVGGTVYESAAANEQRMLCCCHEEAEPSVNLDEELDKLLL